MIPTLRLRDMVRVYALRGQGIALDAERFLVDGYAPMRMALRSLLGNGVRTYISRDEDGCDYLLQLVRRHERPEWDVTFVAPVREKGDRCHQWRPLLKRVVGDAVHYGAYRLYASFPEGHSLPFYFQQNGFRPFTQERIYHLENVSFPLPARLPSAMRPRVSGDLWTFNRLWRHATPALVVAVESLPGNGTLDFPYHWSERPGQRVYVWEEEGELLGAMALRQGRRGAVMRLLLAPDAQEEVGYDLIGWGARLAAPHTGRPLYCIVRAYQLNEYALLADMGFRPDREHTCYVRHLALPVSADEEVPSGLLSMLDIRGEPVYTQSLESASSVMGVHHVRCPSADG